MTVPKKNSDFCFCRIFIVPRGEAGGALTVEGKQNSLFPVWPVTKHFILHVPPNSKLKKTEKICLTPAGKQI